MMSGMALYYVGADIRANFGDSRLNSGPTIRLFVRPDPFCTLFVQYLITFCSRTEAASDVISGLFVRPVVLNTRVNFNDPSLNRSRESPSESVGSGIFDSFFAITSDRKYIMTAYSVWL